MHDPPHPVLAHAAVRHVGDPVAFVVADTIEAARDAAELVGVDYDMLPSITDLSVATEPGAARQATRLRAGVLPGSDRRRSDRTGRDPFRR